MDQVPIFIRSVSYSQAHIRSSRVEIVYNFFKNRPLIQIIFIISTLTKRGKYICICHTYTCTHSHSNVYTCTHIHTNILTHIHIHTHIPFGKALASFFVSVSQWSSPSLNCVQQLPLPLAAEAIVFVSALVKGHDWIFFQNISTEVLVFTLTFLLCPSNIFIGGNLWTLLLHCEFPPNK